MFMAVSYDSPSAVITTSMTLMPANGITIPPEAGYKKIPAQQHRRADRPNRTPRNARHQRDDDERWKMTVERISDPRAWRMTFSAFSAETSP